MNSVVHVKLAEATFLCCSRRFFSGSPMLSESFFHSAAYGYFVDEHPWLAEKVPSSFLRRRTNCAPVNSTGIEPPSLCLPFFQLPPLDRPLLFCFLSPGADGYLVGLPRLPLLAFPSTMPALLPSLMSPTGPCWTSPSEVMSLFCAVFGRQPHLFRSA